MSKRAYKYRFYPTTEQENLLAQTFGCVRVVYNKILSERTKLYYDQKESVDYIKANAMLTTLKKSADFNWLNDVSCVPLQQVLRHQQAAFSNFFAGRAKYPTFKKKGAKQSAEFTKSAFKYVKAEGDLVGKLYMAKSKEPLDIKWSRELPCEPSLINISKDCAGRYFVSCLCEFNPKPLPKVNKTTGIDLGLTHFAIEDNGVKHRNMRFTKKHAAKLASAQRKLSKKKIGSANRAKAKIKIARIHAKIADSRLDYLHKLSSQLINENQVICIESLKVVNMVKNPKLAKHISDASWGEFTRQLEYKAEWAGRKLVKIDQWFPSSKRCSDCGHITDKLPLSIREWACPSCNALLDRDINAAKNIKRQGMSLIAFGENVSAA